MITSTQLRFKDPIIKLPPVRERTENSSILQIEFCESLSLYINLINSMGGHSREEVCQIMLATDLLVEIYHN